MLRLFYILTASSLAAQLFAGQDNPKPPVAPLAQEERSPEWLIAIEKLRMMPRPGEIQNAGILANIGDVIETTPDQRAAIAAALKAYDAAMVQKAAQWESEMKAARAEYEAKIVAVLPEARRDAAKKALEYSHERWFEPMDFEARLKVEYIARREKAADKNAKPEEIEAAKKELLEWINTQRAKSQEKNAETVKYLKAMLDPAEAERLSNFDKNKEIPPAVKKEKK